MSADILITALELLAYGYSVIPIRPDGTKSPSIPWKTYTERQPTEDELRGWFTDDTHDLGVVQGAVSGSAELTELEGRAAGALPELRHLALDTGLGDLWDTITRGWVEMSPSGGFHFHYRITDTPVPGNLKIARGADRLVLAETRGENGQVVVAPSCHHTTGRPWVRLAGGPATAAAVTLEQRNAFHSILRTLNAVDDPAPINAPVSTPHDPGEGITPGDDYETRTDWTTILGGHGWVLVTTRGTTRYWRRPGKTIGISATTGRADDRDRLYVFTSSTDFTPETPYTKLGALAVLEHGGDLHAAAKALHAAGFGQRAEQARTIATNPDTYFDDILPAPPTLGPCPVCPAGYGMVCYTTDGTPHPERHHTTTPTVTPPLGSGTGTPGNRSGNPSGVTTVTEPTTYTETDDGNALRLVDTHGATIRHCPQRDTWLTWNGHRWRWDEAGAVHELARDVARQLPDTDKTATRHRLVSLSRRGIEAMAALARTDHRTVTHLATLDAQPFELNTPAGVIDLRTGQLHAPDPRSLHTRSTTVAPDGSTTPTRWLAFLADTFAGDPAMTTYMQRLLGVSLAGTVLEQVLPFAFGPGANGKTTLLGVVQRIIGIGDDGYSISAPAEMLLATHQQGHPTEIARLSGARLVVTSELEEGQRFAEARIKQLTGRDVISGRFMRQDWFSFVPTHTLWLLANHQPTVRAGGPAFWRRLRLLPFEHTVPVELRVTDLEDRLVDDEGPAILAWLITGAADYFTGGLAEPTSVRTATDAYAGDQDTVSRFVEDACDVGDPNDQHMHVRTSVLRQAYESWCRSEGEEPVTAKTLTITLRTQFGVETARDMHARFYDGIRLTDVSSVDDDEGAGRSGWTQQEGW